MQPSPYFFDSSKPVSGEEDDEKEPHSDDFDPMEAKRTGKSSMGRVPSKFPASTPPLGLSILIDKGKEAVSFGDNNGSSFAGLSFFPHAVFREQKISKLPIEITHRHRDLPESYAQFNTLAEGDCLFIAIGTQRLLQEINKTADAKRYPPSFGIGYRQLFGERGNILLKGKLDTAGSPIKIKINDDTTITQVYQMLRDYDGEQTTIKEVEGRILETLFCEVFRRRVVAYMYTEGTKFREGIDNVNTDEEWESYIGRMLQIGTYGGHPEIRAIRYLLDCPVRVYRFGHSGYTAIESEAIGMGEAEEEKNENSVNPICIVHVPAIYKNIPGEVVTNHYHFAIDKSHLPLLMKKQHDLHEQVLAKQLSSYSGGVASKISARSSSSSSSVKIKLVTGKRKGDIREESLQEGKGSERKEVTEQNIHKRIKDEKLNVDQEVNHQSSNSTPPPTSLSPKSTTLTFSGSGSPIHVGDVSAVVEIISLSTAPAKRPPPAPRFSL